jgi:hypothetical protein
MDCPFFQDRLVKCVGTNADNIRPAQRALEFFKKFKVLDLLLNPMPAVQSHSLLFHEKIVVVTIIEKSLMNLLPALFRGGVLSWNPTVNKMTALALKAMKDRDEDTFMRACNDLFGSTVNHVKRKGTFCRPEVPVPIKGWKSSKHIPDDDAVLSDKSVLFQGNDNLLPVPDSKSTSDEFPRPPEKLTNSQNSKLSKFTTSRPTQRGPISISNSCRFIAIFHLECKFLYLMLWLKY